MGEAERDGKKKGRNLKMKREKKCEKISNLKSGFRFGQEWIVIRFEG
jgi:hypothetical protein